jgi:hypothetical protein
MQFLQAWLQNISFWLVNKWILAALTTGRLGTSSRPFNFFGLQEQKGYNKKVLLKIN